VIVVRSTALSKVIVTGAVFAATASRAGLSETTETAFAVPVARRRNTQAVLEAARTQARFMAPSFPPIYSR